METNPIVKCKVVLDSINALNNERVLTIIVSAPKFINAEIKTHGNIVTNASSSRAIGYPFTKTNDNKPYLPAVIQTPSKGMFGAEEVTHYTQNAFNTNITELFKHSLSILDKYRDSVHKQHLNRYIEAWGMQSTVMTANYYAFQNFINLRNKPDADVNIQPLAVLMDNAIRNSKPVLRLKHVPFVNTEEALGLDSNECLKLSAGRIARVSFNNAEKLEPEVTSLKRADWLIANSHKSCFGHQLVIGGKKEYAIGKTHEDYNGNWYSGRIRNWVKFRKLIWHGLDEKTNSIDKWVKK